MDIDFNFCVFITWLVCGCWTLPQPLTAAPDDPSVLSHWAFDESNGQKLKNSTNNGPDGYLGKSPSIDKYDPNRIAEDKKHSLYFNGSQCVTIPNGEYADFQSTGQFAIQIWLKPFVLSSYRTQVLTKGADSRESSWRLCILKSNKGQDTKYRLAFRFKHRMNEAGLIATDIQNPIDEWNRFTITGDGKFLKIYRNGALKASTPCKAIPIQNSFPAPSCFEWVNYALRFS